MNGKRNRWVLIVDDEPAALTTLADVLREEGFRPHLAKSVGAARAVFETAPVDAAIVDLALGDGTGLQLAEWIWERDPTLPVLFVSAYTDIGLVDEVIERRLSFFPKPLNLPGLLAVLRSAVRQKRRG